MKNCNNCIAVGHCNSCIAVKSGQEKLPSNPVFVTAEGGFGAGEGFDEEGVATGDGEGGAWDVEDEDLELPPDLVSHFLLSVCSSASLCLSVCLPVCV